MKILITGEMYPEIIHGVSIANFTNYKILKSNSDYKIIKIGEKSKIDKIGLISILKIKHLIQLIIKIFRESLKNKPDIIYKPLSVSVPGIIKDFLVLLAAKIGHSKVRVILHLHRDDFNLKMKNSMIYSNLVLYILKWSDNLILLSEGQRKKLKYLQKYIKLSVLENTISPIDESLVSIYKNGYESLSRKGFLFISNYLKEKGIDELITAFSKINYDLKCFGNGPKPSNDFSNIKINGPIIGNNKYKTLSYCEALILPSYNEGQPTIILEAMAFGTIILTTKVGLIEELLGKHYPFYFNKKDSRDLIRCVEKFKKYSSKKHLSRILKKRYRSGYSNEIHRNKLLSIFNSK